MMARKYEYGDGPIDPKYAQQMEATVRALDEVFNGDAKHPNKKVGFILLTFEYGEAGGRCNYASNGASREDVVTMMKEQIKRFEGQDDG